MTNQTTHPTETAAPRCGALAPAFALPDATRPADAEPVRLRAWRQRRPVLLALLPEAAGEQRIAWLRAIAARRADLDEARAITLTIVGGDREAVRALWRQADVAFALLADATGETLTAYLGANATRPALALVNRYSTLISLLPATTADAAPDLDAALRDFAFAEQEDCACGLPIWPVEE
jgi:peroxiredoxin